tara:strand:+ start:671 stop:844 length:174 start_codon:yes stop_codon:yes gene_type:complete
MKKYKGALTVLAVAYLILLALRYVNKSLSWSDILFPTIFFGILFMADKYEKSKKNKK